VEPQGPKDGLVVLDALEDQVGVAEDDVLPVYGVCGAKERRLRSCYVYRKKQTRESQKGQETQHKGAVGG
jgi:hypothetical protein